MFTKKCGPKMEAMGGNCGKLHTDKLQNLCDFPHVIGVLGSRKIRIRGT
jgi:hypothetical protein